MILALREPVYRCCTLHVQPVLNAAQSLSKARAKLYLLVRLRGLLVILPAQKNKGWGSACESGSIRNHAGGAVACGLQSVECAGQWWNECQVPAAAARHARRNAGYL